jgi:AmmeMemoRadiSam system protein B
MTPELITSAHRAPAVAGTFYPASPRELRDDVEGMLARALTPGDQRPPKALIVPHAGYRYSGPVAATAYAALVPFRDHFRRVVLVGPSHRVYFLGLALPEARVFDTPLGPVPVDAGALSCIPEVPVLEAAHAREHAIEVQLPFLQRVLPRFAIVPLVAGEASAAAVAAVLEALWGGPETLIVISSDLSHYLPYEVAHRTDAVTARRIVGLGPGSLHHDQACGATPVNGLLAVARRRRLRPELLDLRSSGDTEGTRDQVVGYGAFAFYEEAGHDA